MTDDKPIPDSNPMIYWDKMQRPPEDALKPISGGRLSGKTDINPLWRYRAMTESFGPIGIGWYPEILDKWTEELEGEVVCSMRIALYIKVDGEWSKPIPGVGGNKLLMQESSGKHVSDEGWKMCYTDALSVAMKMLGVGAEIYMGHYDGSKYNSPTPHGPPEMPEDHEVTDLRCQLVTVEGDEAIFLDFLKCDKWESMTKDQVKRGLIAVGVKREDNRKKAEALKNAEEGEGK